MNVSTGDWPDISQARPSRLHRDSMDESESSLNPAVPPLATKGSIDIPIALPMGAQWRPI